MLVNKERRFCILRHAGKCGGIGYFYRAISSREWKMFERPKLGGRNILGWVKMLRIKSELGLKLQENERIKEIKPARVRLFKFHAV